MKLTISKNGNVFTVDNNAWTGTPPVGRGRTLMEAIGSFVHNNQRELGFEFEVEPSAEPAEMRRRKRELAKR